MNESQAHIKRRKLNEESDVSSSSSVTEKESKEDVKALRECFDNFERWLLDHGALYQENLEFRVTSTGYGIFAKRDLVQGTRAVQVPVNLIITWEHVRTTSFYQAFDAYRQTVHTLPPSDMTCFFLFLVSQRFDLRNDKRGFWYPYLMTIPETFDTPLYWSPAVLKMVMGTSIPEDVELRLSSLHRDYNHCFPGLSNMYPDIFPLNIYTFERYLWAHTAYTSRCFPAQIATGETLSLEPLGKTGASLGCMVPVFDGFNHKAKTKVTWETKTALEEGQVTTADTAGQDDAAPSMQKEASSSVRMTSFVTGMAFHKGDEVLNNYGSKSNEEFLTGYGFAIPNNDDDIFSVALLASFGVPRSTALNRIAQEADLTRIVLMRKKFQPSLLNAMRIWLCDQHEVEYMPELGNRQDWKRTDAIISPRNESMMLSMLQRLITSKAADLGFQFLDKQKGFVADIELHPNENATHVSLARVLKQGLATLLSESYEMCIERMASFTEQYVNSSPTYLENKNATMVLPVVQQDTLAHHGQSSLQAQTIMYTVSRDILITTESISNSTSFSKLMAYIQGLDEHIVTVLFLLHELNKGSASRWAGFLDSVITHQNSNQIGQCSFMWDWKESHVALALHRDTKEYIDNAVDVYQQLFPTLHQAQDDIGNEYLFPSHIFTIPNFLAALIVVEVFTFDVYQLLKPVTVLVPLSFWPKFSFVPTARLDLTDTDEGVTVTSLCKLDIGAEISLYPSMCRSNDELLMKTGQLCEYSSSPVYLELMDLITQMEWCQHASMEEQIKMQEYGPMSIVPAPHRTLLREEGCLDYQAQFVLHSTGLSSRLQSAVQILSLPVHVAEELVQNALNEHKTNKATATSTTTGQVNPVFPKFQLLYEKLSSEVKSACNQRALATLTHVISLIYPEVPVASGDTPIAFPVDSVNATSDEILNYLTQTYNTTQAKIIASAAMALA